MTSLFSSKRVTCLAAALVVSIITALPAIASDDYCIRVIPLLKLDERAKDLRTEIETQSNAIADMQRIVDDSRKPGGAAPDLKRLVPMGQAGTGTVGVGKSKPVEIQRIISEYESLITGSKTVDDHLGDVGLQKAILLRERMRLVDARRRELGYPPGKWLPESEMRSIRAMALGRAVYLTEIRRSIEIRDEFQKRIAEINKERMAIRARLGAMELEKYKSNECAKDGPSAAGEPVDSAADSGHDSDKQAGNSNQDGEHGDPQRKAADAGGEENIGGRGEAESRDASATADTQKAESINKLSAELRTLLDKYEGDLRKIQESARQLRNCEQNLRDVVGLENDVRSIERRIAAVEVALNDKVKHNKDRARELGDLTAAASRISGKAEAAANEACHFAADGGVDATASAEQAKQAANLRRLVEELARRVPSTADAEEHGARIEDVAANLVKLGQDAEKVSAACRAARDYLDREHTAFTESREALKPYKTRVRILGLIRQLRLLRGDDPSAEKISGPASLILPETVEARIAFLDNWMLEIVQNVAKCSKLAEPVRDFCGQKIDWQTFSKPEDLRSRARAIDAEGQRLAEEAKKAAGTIKTNVETATAAASRAGDCQREAASKQADQEQKAKSAGCVDLKSKIDAVSIQIDRGEIDAARAALGTLDASACPDIGPSLEEAHSRIADLISKAVADAAAALDTCHFKVSRDLIKQLPEGAEKTSLASRWNRAYEVEGKVRDLVKAAVAFRDQGKPGAAIDTLRKARSLGPCDSTITLIEKEISRIHDEIAQANAKQAEAALGRCDFKTSRALIDGLPQGLRRAALVEKWNKAYKTERKARNTIKGAVAFKFQGAIDSATRELRTARNLQPCARTVTAIEKAISSIDTQKEEERVAAKERIANATATCQNDHGAGYRVGRFLPNGQFYCVPDQATADSWCGANNQGTGWQARNISEDGGFQCVQSDEGAKASAVADCRRQHGNRLIRVYKSRGEWRCEYKTDEAVAHDDCVRRFGDRLIRVYSKGGQWFCEYQTAVAQTGGGSGQQPGGRNGCPPNYWRGKDGKCYNWGKIFAPVEKSILDTTGAVSGRR